VRNTLSIRELATHYPAVHPNFAILAIVPHLTGRRESQFLLFGPLRALLEEHPQQPQKTNTATQNSAFFWLSNSLTDSPKKRPPRGEVEKGRFLAHTILDPTPRPNFSIPSCSTDGGPEDSKRAANCLSSRKEFPPRGNRRLKSTGKPCNLCHYSCHLHFKACSLLPAGRRQPYPQKKFSSTK